MVTHHRQLVLVFLVASADVDQCLSFKKVKRKFDLPDLNGNINRLLSVRCYPHPHRKCERHYLHHNVNKPLFSIRGGSDGNDDEDIDSIYDFIASFESELSEISREAEMEAASEMQKLRELLIEQRANRVEEEEGETESENYENIDERKESVAKMVAVDAIEEEEETESEYSYEVVDESKEDDDNTPDEKIEDGNVRHNLMVEEEKLKVASDDGHTDFEGDEALPNDWTTTEEEDIDQSEGETGTEDGKREEIIIVEDDDYLQYDEFEPEGSVAVAATTVGDVKVDDYETTNVEVDEDIKPKKPKKKRKKRSKKGKRKKTRMYSFPEESELSDGGDQLLDLGESAMLTRSHDEEITQPSRRSSIWSILRSDLGRALCLFIATVIMALLTQRLQRQMEEADMKV